MPKQERPLNALTQFLPPDTVEMVMPYFNEHVIYLNLTHERKSVFGDYRNPSAAHPYHRISVNATLNVYSFLITLLHEIAHMLTYVQYKNKVSPHGAEWKNKFKQTLLPFVGKGIFPADVERALNAYLKNPAASTCTDPDLYKALHRYDKGKKGWKYIDEIQISEQFQTEDGRTFVKVEKLRTRSKCKDLQSGKMYLFPGVAMVKPVVS